MSHEIGQEFAPAIDAVYDYERLSPEHKLELAIQVAQDTRNPEDRYIALGMANSFDGNDQNSRQGLRVLNELTKDIGKNAQILGAAIDANWYSRRHTAESEFDIKVIYAVFAALGERLRPEVVRFLPTGEEKFLVVRLGDEAIPETPISANPGQSLFDIAGRGLIVPPDPREDGKFSFIGPTEKMDNILYGIKAVTGE